MIRVTCGGCGASELEQILDLGDSPLADHFPIDSNEPETRYPLQVFVCRSCMLVQLGEVVPDDVLWSDYGFYSSTSAALVRYHTEFAALVHLRFGNPLTVELACNDGSLLSQLPGRTIGVDAANGPVKAAQAKGLDVRHGLFGLRLAEQLRDELGPVRLIVAQNVMAHVADLQDFLAGVRHLLANNGHTIFEVQSLADLLLGNQFDHVYHEHRFFFSARSLVQTLCSAGLLPVQIERTPMQGGSLRVTCCRRESGNNRLSPIEFMEHGFTDDFGGLQARADYLQSRLLDLLDAECKRGTVAGWAASAKSATLLNWCGINSDQVPYIVDTTPAKIGRYTPGTHIPVVSPGERFVPDTWLCLAHNYLSRALRSDPDTRWLVPIPHPVVI